MQFLDVLQIEMLIGLSMLSYRAHIQGDAVGAGAPPRYIRVLF